MKDILNKREKKNSPKYTGSIHKGQRHLSAKITVVH